MYNFYLTKEEEKNMKKYQDYERSNHINDTINRAFELTPIDGRKSFCGRCKVLESDSKYYLLSYTTVVCYWDKNNNKFIRLWDEYSATTMRHVNSFLKFLQIPGGGKAWWDSLPVESLNI